jgi:copper chaperone
MSVNQIQVHVENIKCGGCEKSIVKGLMSIEGLSHVEIDREQQLVSVTADASLRDALVAKLKSMGYPEHGSVSGLDAGLANAKSFLQQSKASGEISKDNETTPCHCRGCDGLRRIDGFCIF